MALGRKGGSQLLVAGGQKGEEHDGEGIGGRQDLDGRSARREGGVLERVVFVVGTGAMIVGRRLGVIMVMRPVVVVIVREKLDIRRFELAMQGRRQPQEGQQEGGDTHQAGHGAEDGREGGGVKGGMGRAQCRSLFTGDKNLRRSRVVTIACKQAPTRG
jgi:hypothetical protein